MLQRSPTNLDRESFASPVLAIALLALSSLFVYHAAAFWTWLRAAWILRKLPNGSGNLIYGGLQKVLTFNRLREMQKLNETVINGAGACYFNVLWRQVCDDLAFYFRSHVTPRIYSGETAGAASLHRLTCCCCVQFVLVTDPRLISQLLHDKSLHKPVEPDYAHFQQVEYVVAYLTLGLHGSTTVDQQSCDYTNPMQT